MIYLYGIIIFVAGYWMGFNRRVVLEFLRKIDSKIKEPEVKQGVVRGDKMVIPVHTKPIDDGKPVGVVKPKSPKQIQVEDDIKFRDRFGL